MPRVRPPLVISLLALALCAVFCGPVSAFTCYSRALVLKKLRETRTLAFEHGMEPDAISCMYDKGLQFKSVSIEPRPGLKIDCYKDDKLIEYMVAAMESCVGKAELMTDSRQAALRRPVEPDTPVRAVAHWLGLKETVRKSCHCWSGCHYCCIQTALGGQDFCFDLYCLALGKCD